MKKLIFFLSLIIASQAIFGMENTPERFADENVYLVVAARHKKMCRLIHEMIWYSIGAQGSSANPKVVQTKNVYSTLLKRFISELNTRLVIEYDTMRFNWEQGTTGRQAIANHSNLPTMLPSQYPHAIITLRGRYDNTLKKIPLDAVQKICDEFPFATQAMNARELNAHFYEHSRDLLSKCE